MIKELFHPEKPPPNPALITDLITGNRVWMKEGEHAFVGFSLSPMLCLMARMTNDMDAVVTAREKAMPSGRDWLLPNPIPWGLSQVQ